MCLKIDNGRLISEKSGFIWAEGEFFSFGEAKAPKGITVNATAFKHDGKLTASFEFFNDTDYTICAEKGSLGVWLPFNDSYEDAETCINGRCHAHIWCGGESSWVVCIPMSNKRPYLCAMLTEGSLCGYSVKRRSTSNDRGDFLFCPDTIILKSGEHYKLCWDFFEFDCDFFDAVSVYERFLSVKGETFTFFENEVPQLNINGIRRELPATPGYNTAFEGKSYFRYNVLPTLYKTAEKRCRFIACFQQENGGALNGAYLPYDNETKMRDYRENPNHNAGRERIGMGLLMAKYLQHRYDAELEKSLDGYIAFVLREHFDEATGEVFNELHRDNHRRRIYNNAWYALFFLELYVLKHDKRWLKCMYGAFKDLYEHGGLCFYPLAMEITRSLNALKEADMHDEYDSLLSLFLQNGEFILKNGVSYPKLEVNYEDNIVVPAGFVMCQLFEVTKEEKYISAAMEHLNLHNAFSFVQPDARMFRAAIHHWDDFWFGKRELYGDTYPHYWITAGALFTARMGICTENEKMIAEARAAMRTSLSCFFEDGSASCAIVSVIASNDKRGEFIDPLANDQDWALYQCLVFDELCGL